MKKADRQELSKRIGDYQPHKFDTWQDFGVVIEYLQKAGLWWEFLAFEDEDGTGLIRLLNKITLPERALKFLRDEDDGAR